MGIEAVVTYTTRMPRKGEINDISYHFITKEEFLDKEKQGFFAETTSYNVASGETWYYGSSIEDLEDNKVLIANPEGLKKLKKMTHLNPVVFYIMASEETILERLRKRGDNSCEAKRRLNEDGKDFCEIDKYIDIAIRNDYGSSSEQIGETILYVYKKMRM